ncbi:MAG: enoyl-CoA hydratase-related protein, partial [Dehalococcoidia bacterium]
VLTGTGDRAFCGGRDLRELAEQKKKGKWSPKFEISHKLGMGVWKPIIAAINGYCVAGGFRLAQLCDVRIRP